MNLLAIIAGTVLFAVVAPVLGCLLAGLDRVISARMQGRVGPPVLQPYYDVRKLLQKDDVSVSGVDGMYMTCSVAFTMVAGGIFFSGGNLLMSAFIVTLGGLFFILAAYSTRSPFAEAGAARETLQVMAYEPMVLLMAVAFYLAIGTFNVSGVFDLDEAPFLRLWPVFVGFLLILTIKLRKSPFDLSFSHHAHQELVKGITTEMSGRTLAKVEIVHWAETVLFLGWTGMFFVWGDPVTVILGVVAALAAWFLEIWIDNNFARVRWQVMLRYAWVAALALGGINIAVLMFV